VAGHIDAGEVHEHYIGFVITNYHVIEQAVESVLHAGHRTADLADGNHYLGTDKMVEAITAVIANDSAISSIMTAYS